MGTFKKNQNKQSTGGWPLSLPSPTEVLHLNILSLGLSLSLTHTCCSVVRRNLPGLMAAGPSSIRHVTLDASNLFASVAHQQRGERTIFINLVYLTHLSYGDDDDDDDDQMSAARGRCRKIPGGVSPGSLPTPFFGVCVRAAKRGGARGCFSFCHQRAEQSSFFLDVPALFF